MKISFQKKEISPFLEFSFPRSEEASATIRVKNNKAIFELAHPTLFFSFTLPITVEEEGCCTYSYTSLKKAMLRTKAKDGVITLENQAVFQKTLVDELSKMAPIPKIQGELLPVGWNCSKIASFLFPLLTFTKSDSLPFKNKIFLSHTSDELILYQTNGIHLTKFLFSIQNLPSLQISPLSFSSLLFKNFLHALTFFENDAILALKDGIGVYEDEEHNFFMKGIQESFVLPDFPIHGQTNGFYLNPIDDKPFEEVLYMKLKQFAKQFELTNDDVSCVFFPRFEGKEVVLEVWFSHKGAKPQKMFETTSPFAMNSRFPLLPAFDLYKAMRSYEYIQTFQSCERGLLLSRYEYGSQFFRTETFLHGRI